jgi:hypothetical protein
MALNGTSQPGRKTSKGILSVISDIVFDDVFGEMGWMIVLVLAVAGVIGLIWLAAQVFA